jgi:uncharacterized repeat protein (TIGR04042 family)
MPEMYFTVRWPDGSTERCYSPSLVVEDFLTPGNAYALDDFVERSRTALTVAAQRVRAKYGIGCAQADAQLARIERHAGSYAGVGPAMVTVEAFER